MLICLLVEVCSIVDELAIYLVGLSFAYHFTCQADHRSKPLILFFFLCELLCLLCRCLHILNIFAPIDQAVYLAHFVLQSSLLAWIDLLRSSLTLQRNVELC